MRSNKVCQLLSYVARYSYVASYASRFLDSFEKFGWFKFGEFMVIRQSFSSPKLPFVWYTPCLYCQIYEGCLKVHGKSLLYALC